MKAVFLNIWGGKMYEPLMAFLREHSPTTDFFCLQEVFDSPHQREVSWGGKADILADLRRALPGHRGYFSSVVSGFDGDEYLDFPLAHGNAIFVKKDISINSINPVSSVFRRSYENATGQILSRGDVLIAGEDWPDGDDLRAFPHRLQYVRFRKENREYTLVHLHGTAYPGSKGDTDARISQSRKVIDFLAGEKGEKILGGDFNLLPGTESIRMIERAGMRNLITEYGIKTTRNVLSYGQYPEPDRQYFADYAFVSSGIAVQGFSVPQTEVSDHLPLILECA